MVVVAGLGIGTLLGLFGVGGSSVATPVLSFLGVPGLHRRCVTASGNDSRRGHRRGRPYVRSGEARPKAAGVDTRRWDPRHDRWGVLSRVVGGPSLLVGSGVCSSSWTSSPPTNRRRQHATSATQRRQNRPLLVAAPSASGCSPDCSPTVAGFLLVPLYLLVFGLRMRQAVGTSLLVIVFLAIPTLIDALGARPYRLDHRLRLRRRLDPGERRRRATTPIGWQGRRCAAPLAVPRRLRCVFTIYRLVHY